MTLPRRVAPSFTLPSRSGARYSVGFKTAWQEFAHTNAMRVADVCVCLVNTNDKKDGVGLPAFLYKKLGWARRLLAQATRLAAVRSR